MLQPAAKALWEKSLLPWVCGLLEKSVLTQVHIYSVPTGLWVAEHGADCEHCLRCPRAILSTQLWLLCTSVCWMSTPS